MPKTSKDPSAVKECLLRNCKFSCNPQGTLITTICLSKISVFIINLMQLKVLSTGWCTKCIHQVPPQLWVFLFRSSPQVLCVIYGGRNFGVSVISMFGKLFGWLKPLCWKGWKVSQWICVTQYFFCVESGGKGKIMFFHFWQWHFHFDGCWPPNITTQSRNIHPRNLTWNLKKSPWKRKILLETMIFRFHVKSRCKANLFHLWGMPLAKTDSIQFWAPLGPHSVKVVKVLSSGTPRRPTPRKIPSLVGCHPLSLIGVASCMLLVRSHWEDETQSQLKHHFWQVVPSLQSAGQNPACNC